MIRTYSARVDVYRNGARLTSLKMLEPATITAAASNAIKTGLSGDFLYDDDFDFIKDELRPVQIIDGTEYPAGVFHVSRSQNVFSQNSKFMHIEAYDKCFLLKSTTTESLLYIAKGTAYLDIIQQLITEAGITSVIAYPTDAVMATSREDWPIGTDYLSIVNTLLAEINYDDIWFNVDGYAVLRPSKSLSTETIMHYYSGMDVDSVLSGDCTQAADIYGKPNVFIAVCQNPEFQSDMVAISVNDNSLSRLSTVRRGKRISKVYRVGNIPNQEALQAYANKLRNDSLFSSETLTITTANMPGHGIRDTIAVQHPQVSGIYEEVGWRLSLGAGSLMQHDLQRKVLI